MLVHAVSSTTQGTQPVSVQRVCTQCGFVVENPMLRHCPRCNQLLPLPEAAEVE